MNEKEYSALVKKLSPPSKVYKDCSLAFLAGGTICLIGQGIYECFKFYGFTEKTALMSVPCILILISAILTSLGKFDNLAKIFGAGVLVPITGFSNAVCSPAIEFKSEGRILGTGANLFKIAGPVIAYGLLSSVLYGIIYFVFTRVI